MNRGNWATTNVRNSAAVQAGSTIHFSKRAGQFFRLIGSHGKAKALFVLRSYNGFLLYFISNSFALNAKHHITGSFKIALLLMPVYSAFTMI